ncbi:hypothetical protein FAES_2914 [Fibrella aestuarina BUZ 2]|uniref:Uncharacterized protein n=1 Tax=Fibrella aestuarina BUZ 2 TaxID=1166018 RepID=I0K9X0_9BACT|nr:hypothetical protein [Fibrella aestuarina]CCH00923.1 hypothetical protein FAES_2914 [Fibrella aestuarina BUZ 2]
MSNRRTKPASLGLLSLLGLLLLTGCWREPTEQSRAAISAAQSSILGTFYVARINVYNKARGMTDAENAAIQQLAATLGHGLLHFDSTGFCQSIYYGRYTRDRYLVQGTNLSIRDSTFRDLDLRPNGFSMRLGKRVNGKPVDLEYRAYRLNLGKDANRFLELANTIFRKPAAPQSDEQIRQRVKHTLTFYALFFRAIHDSHIILFKPGIVNLPINFYYGAIALTPFSATDAWATLYATPDDAAKAYALLEEAVAKNGRFRHRRSFALGFSTVLNETASHL